MKKSERPVDALAVKLLEKGESLTHSLTYNFKSRDASASKNLTGHRMHLEGPQISQIHPLKIIAFRKCHGIWICMGVLCHCREQLNDVKIWIPMPIYPTWCSFPFGQSKFWQKYLGKSGPYMLIHFQYEAVAASWSRKKRPVFHRQTPPEYHKKKIKNWKYKNTKEKS